MANIVVKQTIRSTEAVNGAKKLLSRNGKHLEVIIPAGVKTGTLVKLNGALQLTDGYDGDILIQIKVRRWSYTVLAVATIAGLFIIISSIVIIRSVLATRLPDFITVLDEQSIRMDRGVGWYEWIELNDNSKARNPTWQQLRVFLISDKTDQNEYIPDSYDCVDFAKEVHDNAEAAGIKAAFVAVYFEGEETGHAINAFKTTDYGLVYIDCQGLDGKVDIQKGKRYQAISLFEPDYYEIKPLGIVESVNLYW